MANKNLIWPEWYRIIQPKDFLFPENEHKFRCIPEGLMKHLMKRAQTMLDSRPHASTYEKQHWQSIVDGTPPYGFLVKSKNKGN